VVSTKESEHYAAALREQMALGEVILNALGYEGRHLSSSRKSNLFGS